MKIRDSGMPEEAMWASFFDTDICLDRLKLRDLNNDVVDLGCGYGTFTIAAAARTTGTVWAFDIEPDMVRATGEKAGRLGLQNVVTTQRDFLSGGTGLPAESCGYVMAFNILHTAQPHSLLAEAHRILQPGGLVGIIHWLPDPTTPRGPAMEIRPRPEQCRRWLSEAGFVAISDVISLPPYHYGLIGTK